MKTRQVEKMTKKTEKHMMKPWGWTKKRKKLLSLWKKGKRKLHKAALHKAALLPNRKVLLPVRQNLTQNIAGKRKSKRKKQQEKKQAEEQQKKQPSYLEVVVKGGPLEKGQNQPKKKGKLDDMQYVSLGSSSSSSSVKQPQPPTPPQPSRLRGTPAQPEKLELPQRPPRPPSPPKKPLKKRLALDWHNCFQIREHGKDVVPNRHIRAYTGICKLKGGRSSSSALLASKGGRK